MCGIFGDSESNIFPILGGSKKGVLFDHEMIKKYYRDI
jgi:hypothetical protein